MTEHRGMTTLKELRAAWEEGATVIHETKDQYKTHLVVVQWPECYQILRYFVIGGKDNWQVSRDLNTKDINEVVKTLMDKIVEETN